jgi:hypothetical protein
MEPEASPMYFGKGEDGRFSMDPRCRVSSPKPALNRLTSKLRACCPEGRSQLEAMGLTVHGHKDFGPSFGK